MPHTDTMPLTDRADPPLFNASPLEASTANRAYSLIRLFESKLDRRHWSAFVRRQQRSGGAGGVMMLSDARGAAHAVFAWRVRHNLVGEKVLDITDAVLGSLPGRALADALVDSIMELASRIGCPLIEVELPDAVAGPRRDLLLARGFRRVGYDRLLARIGPS